MAIIRMTSDAEKAKVAIAKLYNEGLVGCYHRKDGAFTHNSFRSEPNQTFDDKRQIGNGRKFEEPLNLLDAVSSQERANAQLFSVSVNADNYDIFKLSIDKRNPYAKDGDLRGHSRDGMQEQKSDEQLRPDNRSAWESECGDFNETQA